MWINYNDSEVDRYHPICESALKNALQSLGIQNMYEVLHHQRTSSLEMDFVIQNKRTKKYLCVIEVKRTPSAVHSARYQYQAMSYVQMNEGQSEANFYILTNLEYAFSFRYDSRRPRVFQQMLSPGLTCIGSFSEYENEEQFSNDLTNYFSVEISKFLSGRYSYLVTLEKFAEHMERIKREPKKWKSNLAILLYEYIRGAFTVVSRSDLHDVRLFSNDIEKICNEAAHINFQEIFGYSVEKYESRAYVGNDILVNLFDFGHQSITGDSVADVLHQIVSFGHEHEGEVPTDLELGRVLAVLTKYVSGNILEDEKICDPAAGSGNLLSSAISEYCLLPHQIKANDINAQLGELLTLRLGLYYASIVGNENTPYVTCDDICDIPCSYFDDVKVVVMNPPFLGGVYAADRKQKFYSRIETETHSEIRTNIGQMPLEAVFLELIINLVKPGTTVACVFPKTHLLARGIEAQVIRKMLLERFGLKIIFNYPGKDLFVDVTRDTCVLIGKIGEKSDSVIALSSYETINNLDLQRLQDAISYDYTEQFSQIMPGVVGRGVSLQLMKSTIEDGWRFINSEMLDAIDFVDDCFNENARFKTIGDCSWNMKRGGAGNNGGSDLLFCDSRPDFYRIIKSSNIETMPGMRNAELNNLVCNYGDSEFLDASKCSSVKLGEAIQSYIALPSRDGSQARYTKTEAQWKKIIEKESRGRFVPYVVLIPRALRRKGRVHLVCNDIFVSTNFLVCYGMSERDAVLLSTWISTVFYQLICEVSSKDQEGMRKMEVKDIELTYVPLFSNVSDKCFDDLSAEIENIEFLDLQSPVIRNVDIIWAKEIFGVNGVEKVNKAKSLLQYLATKRNP